MKSTISVATHMHSAQADFAEMMEVARRVLAKSYGLDVPVCV